MNIKKPPEVLLPCWHFKQSCLFFFFKCAMMLYKNVVFYKSKTKYWYSANMFQ